VHAILINLIMLVRTCRYCERSWQQVVVIVQPDRLVLDLPTPEGWKAELT